MALYSSTPPIKQYERLVRTTASYRRTGAMNTSSGYKYPLGLDVELFAGYDCSRGVLVTVLMSVDALLNFTNIIRLTYSTDNNIFFLCT